MSLLMLPLFHALLPAVEMLLRPNGLLGTLNTLVVLLLATSAVNSKAVVSQDNAAGLMVVWMTGIGTILLWLFAIAMLQMLGLLTL
jgi:hypothetical protein